MQHLNDDMDELFRKAAEEYPLDTHNADWNKIAARLGDSTLPPVPVRRKYRRFGWLLLLLPLAFVVMRYSNTTISSSAEKIAADSTNPKPGLPLTGGEIDLQKIEDPTTPHENSREIPANISARPENSPASQHAGKYAIAEAAADRQLSGAGRPVYKSEHPASLADAHDNQRLPKMHNLAGSVSKGQKPAGLPVSGAKQPLPKMNHESGESSNVPELADIETGKVVDAKVEMVGELTAFDKPVSRFQELPDMDAIKIPPITTIVAGRMRKPSVQNKRFYLGAIIGMDLSAVKLQKFSGVGFHYGGMMGYQFGRKLSIEAGLYVAKKYYYTKGEYFNKGRMVINPTSSVLSVDGACQMFEIPVSIKYDVHNTYKSGFFVTGGFSSYIMKEENYAMLYRYNTSGTTAVHNYTYKNSSKNFFAELRLTAGYAVKLPRSFSVRIEPYLNIPVSGVGYGKLNLMSAGINAGIFRQIF